MAGKGKDPDKICRLGISNKGKIKYITTDNPQVMGIDLDDPVLKMDIRKTKVSQNEWVNPQLVNNDKILDNALSQNKILFEGAFEKALGLYGANCSWENDICTINWKNYEIEVDMSYTGAKGTTIQDIIEETKEIYKKRAAETAHELIKDHTNNIIKIKKANINIAIHSKVERKIKEHFTEFGMLAELRHYTTNNAPGGGIHKRAIMYIIIGGPRQYEINTQIPYEEIPPAFSPYTDEDASKPNFEKNLNITNLDECINGTADRIFNGLLEYKIQKLIKEKNTPPYVLDFYNVWKEQLKNKEPWILTQKTGYIKEITEIKTMTSYFETPWFTSQKEKGITFNELGEKIRNQIANTDMQEKIDYLKNLITQNHLTVSVTKGDGIWIGKTTINLKSPYTSTIKTLDPDKNLDEWKQSLNDVITNIKVKDEKEKQSILDTMGEPESEILTSSILKLASVNNCLTENTIVQNLRGKRQTISAKVEDIETSGKLKFFPADKIEEEINRLINKGFLGRRQYETYYQTLYHIRTTIKGKQYLLLKENEEEHTPIKNYIKNLGTETLDIKNYIEMLDLDMKPEEYCLQIDTYINIYQNAPAVIKQILKMRIETEKSDVKKQFYKKLEKAVK